MESMQIASRQFYAFVLGGGIFLLVLGFGLHYLATHSAATKQVTGIILSRADGKPLAGAQLYASASPVMVLTRKASDAQSVVLGGTNTEPLTPVGKTFQDGSFTLEVPQTPGASILAVDEDLAPAFVFARVLENENEKPTLWAEQPCQLTGHVYDKNGKPIPEVFVRLVPFGFQSEKPRWQTWTDSHGAFRFEKLPAGWLTVSVLFPAQTSSVNHQFTESIVVRVAAGDVTDIAFGPSGTLRGEVRDKDGKIVPFAKLRLQSSGLTAEGRFAAYVETKESGNFLLHSLSGEAFRGAVRNPIAGAFPPWLDVGDITVPPTGDEQWTSLQPGSNTIRLRLAPQSALDYPFPEKLASTGKPPKKTILFYPTANPLPCNIIDSSMTTNPPGRAKVYDPEIGLFTLESVPEGEYSVVAQIEGYGAGMKEAIYVSPELSPVYIELLVILGGPVIVEVFHPDGRALPHATVSLWYARQWELARGKAFEELWPGPGEFSLQVEADGFKRYEQKFQVLVGSGKTIKVILEPEALH